MLNSTLRFIQKLWVLTFVGMAFYAGEPALAASAPGDVVGKVSVGYQGWFGAAGDGSPQNNWWHWSQNWGQIFSPSNNGESDSWPDVRDYTRTYQTGFANLGNGQPATVFSSYDQQTVNAQVSWMQQNGIDTIALQRFNPAGEANRDGMAARVRTAAETFGRKFYIMYDITGWQTMDTDLKTDWTNKMSAHTASPMYARQNGKPVVCIWMATSTRPVSELLDIVNWFKGQGVYVILGVPRDWRTADATKLPVYNAANMLSPWLIGAVGNISDANNIFNTFMVPDQAYCNAHGIDYQPVVLPGDLRLHQRSHGNLMWTMFYNAVRLGTQGIYISMYDEYGEGNQIMKTAETQAMVPVGGGYVSLDEDGTHCTSDYYIRLTGAADRMFKGLMPLSVARPTNPGGAQRLVPGAVVALKAVVNGEFVCGFSAPLIANCTTQQESFQVVDAGNGNIALRSLDNNDYVTAENAGASSLIADQPALGPWQTFTEVDAENGNIGLLATANGKYVSAANAGASPLIASSTSVGSSESFTVVPGTSSCSTVPSAPSGLTATAASSSQINLSWTASSAGSGCSTTYSVFRSTTSGFTPSSSNQIASGLTSTSFSNTGLAASTAYFYLVEAADSAGSSGPSNQASATTRSGGGTCTSICIDSGSTTGVSPFGADKDFSGGMTINHANTINTSKVTNPAPAAVYQTARIATTTTNGAKSFTYTIPGFTAGSSHTVRLHFCETFFTTKGSRVFNVSINGTQVLTNFDIVAASGGQNIANIQQFTATADASGHITITFTSTTNNALISGIEID